MIRVLLATLLVGYPFTSGLHGQAPAQRAEEIELRALAVLADTAQAARIQGLTLLQEAGELWMNAGRSVEAASAFERAALTAFAAREGDLGAGLYGRALRVRDPDFDQEVHDRLEQSPLLLAQRDLQQELEFLNDTRDFASTLDLTGVDAIAASWESAADAHFFLEGIFASMRTTDVAIRSDMDGLDVRLRPLRHRYFGGGWESIRTDTTLLREPVSYELCYIDPQSQRTRLLEVRCTNGCLVEVPNPFAEEVISCDGGRSSATR
jgi:hypothetical protein